MVTFIAKMIRKQADVSEEKGIAKYKAYFVKTKIYAEYRNDVDTILRTDGYENVIVAN